MSEKLPQPEDVPMNSERYDQIFNVIEDWAYALADQPGESLPGNHLARMIEITVESTLSDLIKKEDEEDVNPKLLEKFIADTGLSLSELQQYVKKTNMIIEELDKPAKRASKFKDN